MSREALAAMIAAKQAVYKENPYWVFQDDKIKHRNGVTFDIYQYQTLFDTVKTYFKTVFDSFQTEAQVLVVSSEDYEKLVDFALPTIPTHLKGYVVVVLPQENTWGNTSVSEVFWQTKIVDQDIAPLMRIHSHHTLNAYQSSTDWSSLNSGTLEVVLGKIYDDEYRLAYWLDERGKDTKEHVWTSTYSSEPEKIPSGNPQRKLEVVGQDSRVTKLRGFLHVDY